MTKLFVRVVGRANSASDFFPHKITVSRPQPRKMTSDCIDGHVEYLSDGFVTRQTGAASEKRLQRAKEACLTCVVEFCLNSFQCTSNECGCPSALVLFFLT